MAMTDFSSLQKSIQDAFDTYWRVREGREQRGENEKTRQMQMQMSIMGERGATQRAQMGIASAEKIAGGELALQKELGMGALKMRGKELDEQIRMNMANEDLLRDRINKELAEKKLMNVMPLLMQAANVAGERIKLAQQAFKIGKSTNNWNALLGMPEFKESDLKSFMKQEEKYGLQSVADAIIKRTSESWKPMTETTGFDFKTHLQNLYREPQVLPGREPGFGEPGQTLGGTPIEETPNAWIERQKQGLKESWEGIKDIPSHFNLKKMFPRK